MNLISENFTVGKYISIIFRYGQNYMNRKLEPYHIGRGQNMILFTLFKNGGIRQEDLACYLKIDKGSIAKSLKKLEDEGYIERRIDDEDKRAYKVYLTQKGIDIMPVLEEAARQWEDGLTADLSEEEKQKMKHLLNKMAMKAFELNQPIGKME